MVVSVHRDHLDTVNGAPTMARTYDRDSIHRALDHHTAAGRIRSWREAATPIGTRIVVILNTIAQPGELELRNLREAWLFVAGLASAAGAPVGGRA